MISPWLYIYLEDGTVALGNTYIPTERHKWLAHASVVRPKGAYGARLTKESITRSSTVQKSLGLS